MTRGSVLTNPALLAGAAGLMAQLAMQQTMDEITDYLAAIDEKVDDVLRAQKDAVLADMIGAGFVIEEAMTVRDQVGRVSEITWSKVQAVSPEELDRHRIALRIARENRIELIARSTERLMARLDAAADLANMKVLLHPTTSPAVVQSGNQVAVAVVDFHGRLGIEHSRQSQDAKRWMDAAAEARDKALETAAEGVGAGKRLGNETLDRAKSVTGKLSGGIVERVRRRRGDDAESDDES